jgi:glucose/arabinose dehydrogenase
MKRLALLATWALAGCGSVETPSETDSAISLPAQFADEAVASVGSPTALAFLPDGRLLVTTQPGRLRVVRAGALVATPALDLSSRVCANSERGMLGVAVDPSFATNHFIYLYWTFNKFNTCATNSPQSPLNRVARYVLGDNDVVDPNTERVLIDNIPSPAGNHNAGDLHFGPDGFLYVSVGDGGCKLGDASRCGGNGNDNARQLSLLSGKILRITRDGAIPSDNPQAGVGGSRRCGDPSGVPSGTGPCQEMWAWGLRNPFRFSFRAGSSEMFINDVGQNVWEEIDRGQKGADYGWNAREGHCANGSTTSCGAPPAGMTNPIFDYQHNAPASSPFAGCGSITGGAFIPAGVWPADYDGAYLFSDYVAGKIFRLRAGSGSSFTADAFATSLGGSSAVDLIFDRGALYYTSYANGGEVRRIRYTGTANQTPSAAMLATPSFGALPLAVTLDGSASRDPDAADTLTYLWSFGDGTADRTTTTPTVAHTYSTAGAFTASLRVRDNHGALSTPVTARIDAGNTPPVPHIDTPTANDRFGVGDRVTLSGGGNDAEDGSLRDAQLAWTVLLHHDMHTHPFAQLTGASVQITAPQPEDLLAATNSFLEVYLTATDSGGLSRTARLDFLPAKVAITLVTEPAGLPLSVSGTAVTGPATLTSWRNHVLNLSATAPTGFVFDHWSDGGAAAHAITTPATPTRYTAVFTESKLGANIIFQPAGTAVPSGYVADTGAVYGARTGGLTYGWDADNSAQARVRNVEADPRYDTLIHLQKPANPNAKWELAVPSGSYRVHIAAGDPSNFDSVFVLQVEGTTVVSGTPSTGARFVEGTATVQVTDGKLTVSNGPGAQNNKICFIDVTQL